MNGIFTQEFDRFTCDGDTITATVGDFELIATVHYDQDADRPDQMQDGFWPSLDPKDAGYIGPKSKRALQRAQVRAREVMTGWENDRWFYCGVTVTVRHAETEVELTPRYGHALWGVECNYPTFNRRRRPNTYLREVANELAHEALNDARATLAKMQPSEL